MCSHACLVGIPGLDPLVVNMYRNAIGLDQSVELEAATKSGGLAAEMALSAMISEPGALLCSCISIR